MEEALNFQNGGRPQFFQKRKTASIFWKREDNLIFLDISSQRLGEMLEGDSAKTCPEEFPLMPMGGREEGLVQPAA